jgi:cytoskeletal protein CcmA (bactofilin family)
MRADKGEDMVFGKSSDQMVDELRGLAPSRTTKGNGAAAQPPRSGVAQPAATPETAEKISTLGPGMTIVGKIDCEGTLHIFGRIEGELRATNVLIGNGAQFDGNVIAQGVTIDGRLKGTIYAERVNLQRNAVVAGDIFHKLLSIEEDAQFEGSSRRQQNPTEAAPKNSTDAAPKNSSDAAPNNPNDARSGLKFDWKAENPLADVGLSRGESINPSS